MKKRIINSMLLLLLSSSSLLASANAGYEQEIKSGEKVVLNGTETTLDYGGKFIRINWVQVDTNKQIKLFNKHSLSCAIIAPDVEEATTFRFALITKELYSINRNKIRENYRFSSTSDFVNVIVYPRIKKPLELEGISGLKPPQHIVNNSKVKSILPPKLFNGQRGSSHEVFLTESTKVETRFTYKIIGDSSSYSPARPGIDVQIEPIFIKNPNPDTYGYDPKTSEIIVPAGVSSFIIQIRELPTSTFFERAIYKIFVGNKFDIGEVSE